MTIENTTYVACIRRENKPNESWCGKTLSHEFHFIDIDHAALNGEQKGLHVACPSCAKKIIESLCMVQKLDSSTIPKEDMRGLTTRFIVDFPCPVTMTNDPYQRIVKAISDICDHWESENPEMVMWPFMFGGEGTVDIIEVHAREDFYGDNPKNPNGEQLRAESNKDQ